MTSQQGEVEKKETEAVHKAAGETVQAAVKAGINRKKIQEGKSLSYCCHHLLLISQIPFRDLHAFTLCDIRGGAMMVFA